MPGANGRDILEDVSDAALLAAVEENEVAAFSSMGRAIGSEVEERDGLWRLVNPFPSPMVNRVMRSRLRPGDADSREAIAWAVRPFRERELPFVWTMWPAARPAKISPDLERHGLTLAHSPPVMAFDLGAGLEPQEQWGASPDFVVRVVDSVPAMQQYLEVAVTAFGLSSSLGELLLKGYRRTGVSEPDSWRHFVGLHRGVPVSCGSVCVAGGVAGVYTVGTVPDARRRGFGRAVTGAGLRHARDLGYRTAVLWASATGRLVYLRMGFREFGTLTVYLGAPGP